MTRNLIFGLAGCMLVFAMLAPAGAAGGEAAKSDTPDLEFHWKQGIRFGSADKAFSFKLGGRIMNDWFGGSLDSELESAVGELESGTEFRRARLYLSGTIYGNVIFKAQYDFAGGDADFKDMYLGVKGLGVLGTVKIGHFHEPFSLETRTSSKYITFLERALPVAFSPERNTGIGFKNHVGKRFTYGAGVYREADGYGEGAGTEGGYSITARITGLPLYSGGDRLLHLGVSLSHRAPAEKELRYRERPELHMADRFVDTGTIADVDSVLLSCVELALVMGSFSLQGEQITAAVSSAPAGDPSFSAYYVQASFFLTGEHRRYKTSLGSFSRIKVERNAVELAVRYSAIDLTDGEIAGGEMSDITAGINWYLNPNTRFMLNYVRADVDGSGTADLFGVRFQIDF
jgi:phosphate-selective porin OprO/OprP